MAVRFICTGDGCRHTLAIDRGTSCRSDSPSNHGLHEDHQEGSAVMATHEKLETFLDAAVSLLQQQWKFTTGRKMSAGSARLLRMLLGYWLFVKGSD
jgi:hypothetical protein